MTKKSLVMLIEQFEAAMQRYDAARTELDNAKGRVRYCREQRKWAPSPYHQDLVGLEAAESRRDQAYQEVKEAKEQRDSLWNQLKNAILEANVTQ